MRCPACGADNQTGARFCNSCGVPLAAACARCGHANPAGSRFCNECGAKLGGAPGPGPATPAPAPVAAPLVVPPGPEERRPVTVLFADIVGFTALAERLADDGRDHGPLHVHGVLAATTRAQC